MVASPGGVEPHLEISMGSAKLLELLRRRVMDLIALAAWMLGATAFVSLTARHLDRRGIL